MKFYTDKFNKGYSNKIICNKLTAIYYYKTRYINFYKNGVLHNIKNASYIGYTGHIGYKEFRLNGKYCGCEYDFTKKSWRRFVKLQAFI